MCTREARNYLVVLVLACTVASAEEPHIALSLHVAGAEPQKGQILATLFGSEESYMREPTKIVSGPVDAKGSVVLNFGKLEPGDYAISVIYDENTNGELDTGLFGIPKEKFGFSNNASAKFGPPKWKDARFVLVGEDTQLEIRLDRAVRK